MNALFRVRFHRFVLTSMLVLCAHPAQAQHVVRDGFEDTKVASIVAPSALAVVPDGRLLIASQYGLVYVYRNGVVNEAAALDLTDRVCTYRERGLVGLAVDPQFADNHYIYVSYSFNKFGNCEAEEGDRPVGRVARFTLGEDDHVDTATEQVLIDNVESTVGVHNLDDVEFGKDGYLYVSVGDGGCDWRGDSGCYDTNDAARDLSGLNGKLLRITRDGEIPADNPFRGADTVRCGATGHTAPGLTCQEIFAFGLRNPWRMAFDPNAPGTRFFINDVGQDTWEEIDEGVAGADYGWNFREGFCVNSSTTDCSPVAPEGLTNPIFAYDRAEGCASVTGGAFVPAGIWPAEFDGTYLFSDYVCGAMFVLRRLADGSYVREPFATSLGNSSAVDMLFAPADDGMALYYTSYADDGELRRITFVGGSNRKPEAVAHVAPTSGPVPLTVVVDAAGSTDPDGDALSYLWDFGDGSAPQNGPHAQHTYTETGVFTLTLQVSDAVGASSTASMRIDAGNTAPQPVIEFPQTTTTFAVGDTIVLHGRADDVEDGALPASALTWRVLLHHNTHTHGFLPPTSGNDITFHAPGPENLEAAATSYLEIQLTATDSGGSSTTLTQALMPRTSQLEFVTSPAGARLRIDNADVTTPFTVRSWVNFGVEVDGAVAQPPATANLTFASWSDGAAARRVITTPAADSTYVAEFSTQAAQALPIPGTIQVEDFDNGGEGVGYHDLSPGNAGGQYRPTDDVDIATTTDTGGSYVVGWAFAGEWLAYSVNVATAGAYDFRVRVASDGPGGTFHVDVDGVDVTGPLTVPSTGGWDTWTDVTKASLPLAAGPHIWRLVMDANGATTAVGNFNWIQVTPSSGGGGGTGTPYGGVPVSLPGTIEAENFDEGGEFVGYHDLTASNSGGQYRNTGVDIATTTDLGGGLVVGWAFAGEWLQYTVNVAEAGTYDVAVRLASAGPGGRFHIEVDSVDKTGPIDVPDTGGWDTGTTVTRAGINLAAGQQVWRIVMDANGPTTAVANFNELRVAPAGGGAVTLLRQPYLQQVTESSAIVVWTARQPAAPAVRYSIGGGATSTVAASTRFFSAADTGLPYDFYQYEADLSALAPSATYSYDVLMNGDDVTAGQGSFRTAPARGTGSIRFLAFGDSGTGSAAQSQVAARMAAESFDLAVHVGDVAYGNEALQGGGHFNEYDDWFFGMYASSLRTHPFYPVIGNHDDEVADAWPFRQVFVLPENGATPQYPDHAERYYSFDYGPVHFVGLDTETAFRDDPGRQAAQLAWLEQDLAATSQPWRVVFFHRSPYSTGAEHGSDLEVRQKFAPLFERYGVQLVLSGHDHDYERTFPMRDFGGPSSVTYVVTGGGGAALYPVGSASWTALSASVYHFVRASVSTCVLQVEAVDSGGAVFDRYSIDRCS
jgi:glucose/arabinose dehydrogenase/PKD repeat protein